MSLTLQQIEAFSDYMGADPAPDDFDRFWSNRMREADDIPLSFEFTPADVPDYATCQFQNLRFRGMDEAELYAKVLMPASNAPFPVVLQFHGYPGASRSWLEQASFVGMGCAVIALDCPGQGGFGSDPGGYCGTTVAGHIVAGLDGAPEAMYYTRLFQNIRILCRIVRRLPYVDLTRVFVNGGSQGGALGLVCCALNSDFVARAAILYPFLSDFRTVWNLQADQTAYEGLRYYTRWFDPEWKHLDEVCKKLGYIDVKNFASLVRCPVLFGTGLADGVCPPKAQFAVFNNLCCPKWHRLFEGRTHDEIQEFDDMIPDFFLSEGLPE